MPVTDRANAELVSARVSDQMNTGNLPGGPAGCRPAIPFAVVPWSGTPIAPESILATASRLLAADPAASTGGQRT